MTITDVIYAKPVVADDGCDHTALILWRMNANARARTRSPYIPAPIPVQVSPKKFAPAHKGENGKRSKRNKPVFPAKNLVGVMPGKTLSRLGILSALDAQYAGHGMSRQTLNRRINSMIKSPFVNITVHEKPVPEYTLQHVDDRYYVHSSAGGKRVEG